MFQRICRMGVYWSLVLALPGALAAGDAPWKQISDEDGIRVFTKEVSGSPLIALRGEGVVEAPIAKLAGVLLNTDRATEWIDSLEELKDLKAPTDKEYLRYSHVGTPIVMKDREFVTAGQVETDLASKTFILKIHSVDSPLAPKTNYVRGEILESAFTLQSLSPGKTRVSVEIHCDPKGSVAKWIVNLFQKNWPRNTLRSLRKQAAKPDIQEHPYYQKLFSGDSKS